MQTSQLLHKHLADIHSGIHGTRLQSLMDVASALQKGQNLGLTAMGRNIEGDAGLKHKIKKVDRLEGNLHLHSELDEIYCGLSSYVFKYISYDTNIPILIDLCFIKDKYDIQMLSAEVATKGRSIPLVRDVFAKKGLKGRARSFLSKLSKCIPSNKKILVIMDAGFGEDWLKEIEMNGWYWLTRVRSKKKIKLKGEDDWMTAQEFIPKIENRTKNYNDSLFMIKHSRPCRIITKKPTIKNTKNKYTKQPRNYNAGSGNYRRTAKEPWILATNLPSEYNSNKVINYYSKRMQIEESFRDVKSHQFGLGARYARTVCIHRWGVKMLLAAIVQIIFWILGIIGHSQGFQKKFQANTVKDKKIFSYFYLGQLIVEHGMVHELKIDYRQLSGIIDEELSRKW